MYHRYVEKLPSLDSGDAVSTDYGSSLGEAPCEINVQI